MILSPLTNIGPLVRKIVLYVMSAGPLRPCIRGVLAGMRTIFASESNAQVLESVPYLPTALRRTKFGLTFIPFLAARRVTTRLILKTWPKKMTTRTKLLVPQKTRLKSRSNKGTKNAKIIIKGQKLFAFFSFFHAFAYILIE